MHIDDNDKFKEECGVFGIYSKKEMQLKEIMYLSLNALQHRGQESCGAAYFDGKDIKCYKGMGLVSEVLSRKDIGEIKGFSGIGHVRYSTFGESTLKNAQPIVEELKNENLAIAHNGNITNAEELRKNIELEGIQFKTDTDSEIILKLIILKLIRENKGELLTYISKELLETVIGGYAIVIFTKNELIAFRDKQGIRPLCIGEYEDGYVVASESCVFDIIGASFIRDVEPGEVISINKDGIKSLKKINHEKCKICSFEYIYFSRPDSIVDGVSVYGSRIKMGETLYKEHPVCADIVIGVPESGIPAALGYARASGIPYDIGFTKNNFVGRTFITHTQECREKKVNCKLNVIKQCVKGKSVVVVDDSIVRGTTSKNIIQKLREAGAKEIHYRIASPEIKSPCNLGINTKSKKELLAASKSIFEIKEFLGVDSLGYLSKEGLMKAVEKNTLCLKCFYK